MAGALIAGLLAGKRRVLNFITAIPNTTSSFTDHISASASFALQSDGLWSGQQSSGLWCSQASQVGLYEAFASLTSGSTGASGLFGQWLDLTSGYSWAVTADRGTLGSTTQTITFQLSVRRKGTAVILTQPTITLSATAIRDVTDEGTN